MVKRILTPAGQVAICREHGTPLGRAGWAYSGRNRVPRWRCLKGNYMETPDPPKGHTTTTPLFVGESASEFPAESGPFAPGPQPIPFAGLGKPTGFIRPKRNSIPTIKRKKRPSGLNDSLKSGFSLP